MAAESATVAPPLEFVGRVQQIPLVEAALLQSLALYEKVKGSFGALHWALSTAELAARKAVETAAPLARRLGPRVQAVDRALCKALDAVEYKTENVEESRQINMVAEGDSVAPPLEFVGRVQQIPLVEAAVLQSLALYGKAKGSRGVLHWALSTAELAARKAVETAAPVARRLGPGILAVDRALCKALDVVENKAQIFKKPSEQIYDTAKSYLAPAYSNVVSIRDKLSWNNAGAMLAFTGKAASTAVFTVVKIAEQLLGRILPPTEEELSAEKRATAAATTTTKTATTTANTIAAAAAAAATTAATAATAAPASTYAINPEMSAGLGLDAFTWQIQRFSTHFLNTYKVQKKTTPNETEISEKPAES